MKDARNAIGFVVLMSIFFALVWQRGFKPVVKEDFTTPVVKDYRTTEWKEVEMNVSAYCPCERCCGEWADGHTASGTKADGKLIAADSRYPFGTVMDIPGYGIAKVEDRGGAIKGNKIDLLFPTHQEALGWGRQFITVKVKEN